MPALLKIDCVMTRVPDLESAATFYQRVFGLRRVWADANAIGMGMTDTDSEIVLHTLDIPADYGVHYLVDSADEAAAAYAREGCAVRVPAFDIAIGRCAVVSDPFGNPLALVDFSKGARR